MRQRGCRLPEQMKHGQPRWSYAKTRLANELAGLFFSEVGLVHCSSRSKLDTPYVLVHTLITCNRLAGALSSESPRHSINPQMGAHLKLQRFARYIRLAVATILVLLVEMSAAAQDLRVLQPFDKSNTSAPRHPDAVPRDQCFPLESLTEKEHRELSEKLLLDALDSEAIYTIVASVKPVSEGFWSTRFRIQPPNTTDLDRVQAALSVWVCGEVFQADTIVFENLIEGERHASAWICNRPALTSLVASQHEYFGRLGVSPQENPEVVLLSIERSQLREERWRGFGLVFGYPEYSIDFFIRAGKHQAETGEFIQRDFRSFPTQAGKTGRFVYAVPKLTEETESEKSLRSQCESLIQHYTKLREEYIGNEKPGVVRLIRDWFDDGSGYCHPSHAVRKSLVDSKVR